MREETRELSDQVAEILREALRSGRQGTPRALDLLDALPACVSYIDRDLRYRYMNRCYESWFSRPRPEMLGLTVAEVLGDMAYRYVKPYVERALAGETVRFRRRQPVAGGAPQELSVTLVPFEDDAGVVQGCAVLAVEVGTETGPAAGAGCGD